jgi:hypothetical protein
MSLFSVPSPFSGSSRRNHYRNGHNGSRHYRQEGLLGHLLDAFASRSGSGRYYNNYGQPYLGDPYYPNQQPPVYPGQQPTVHPNAAAMQCAGCHSAIPAGSKFCLKCGQKISEALFCISCGEGLPTEAKFCLKCGAPVKRLP